MSARGWAIVAAGAAALLVADSLEAEPLDPACELARSDRATTRSSRCVACHDGSVGPGVPFQMSGDGLGMSHPVDVEYDRARARYGDRYVPEALLPDDVPLVDGKVACTSCHDGASPEPKHVLDPVRLCYACHAI